MSYKKTLTIFQEKINADNIQKQCFEADCDPEFLDFLMLRYRNKIKEIMNILFKEKEELKEDEEKAIRESINFIF